MRVMLAVTLAACLAVGLAARQTAPPQPPDQEAVLVAQAAAALSQNNFERASAFAAQALRQFPRSAAALPIYVRAEIARGGARGGLTVYEQWLGQKRVDDAYVLRLVALAVLREAARPGGAADVRREAVRALAAEGDAQTLLDLISAVQQVPQAGDTEILASLGNEEATRRLIARLKDPTTPSNKSRLIEALGASRSPLAVPPLIDLLADPNADTRAAAAAALGNIGAGAAQAVPKLQPLLNEAFPVKFQAAGALFKLKDMSGLTFLREMELNGQGILKAESLEMTASQPDPLWQSAVRRLIDDPNPIIRLRAASLLAPYDPDLSRTVLDGLSRDGNLAIRTEAERVFVDSLATDFAALRKYLSDPTITRVRAASRILELTR